MWQKASIIIDVKSRGQGDASKPEYKPHAAQKHMPWSTCEAMLPTLPCSKNVALYDHRGGGFSASNLKADNLFGISIIDLDVAGDVDEGV